MRGNCTAPNECTCWCKNSFRELICDRKIEKGESYAAASSLLSDARSDDDPVHPRTTECRGPFQDMLGNKHFTGLDLVNYRNLLEPYEIFGTRSCRRGYEGTVNETYDRYMSCHLKIFTPTVWEYWTITIIIVSSIASVVILVMYVYIRRKIKLKYLQAKIERRRSRRSSEESEVGGRYAVKRT